MYNYNPYVSFMSRVAKKTTSAAVHAFAEEHELAVTLLKETKKFVLAVREVYEDYEEHLDGLEAVLQPLFEEVDNRIEQEQADFAAELDARVVEFEETYRAMHSLDLHSDQSVNLDTHAPYMPYDGI
jgi:hypothetical protein